MQTVSTVLAVVVTDPPAVNNTVQATIPVPKEFYDLSIAAPVVNFLALALLDQFKGRAISFTVLAPVVPTNFSWAGNFFQLPQIGAVANSHVLDYPNIPAGTEAILTITTPCTTSNLVVIAPTAAPPAGLVFDARISAANTVSIRASNVSAGAINPPPTTFNVRII